MTRSRFVASALLCCIVCFAGCSGRGKKAGSGGDGNIEGTGDGSISENQLGDRPMDMEILDSVKFENVLFSYDRAQVDPPERAKIEKVGDYLKRNPDIGVVVEGHCDERGSREYNMALGERRALAVRAYLIGLGIDGENIQTVSYGKEKPLLFGHDEQSWRANRRAEFVFFHQ